VEKGLARQLRPTAMPTRTNETTGGAILGRVTEGFVIGVERMHQQTSIEAKTRFGGFFRRSTNRTPLATLAWRH